VLRGSRRYTRADGPIFDKNYGRLSRLGGKILQDSYVSAVMFRVYESVVAKIFRVSAQIAHSGTANSSSYKTPTANRFT